MKQETRYQVGMAVGVGGILLTKILAFESAAAASAADAAAGLPYTSWGLVAFFYLVTVIGLWAVAISKWGVGCWQGNAIVFVGVLCAASIKTVEVVALPLMVCVLGPLLVLYGGYMFVRNLSAKAAGYMING